MRPFFTFVFYPILAALNIWFIETGNNAPLLNSLAVVIVCVCWGMVIKMDKMDNRSY